jgi:hypothetical protein
MNKLYTAQITWNEPSIAELNCDECSLVAVCERYEGMERKMPHVVESLHSYFIFGVSEVPFLVHRCLFCLSFRIFLTRKCLVGT